MSHKAIGLIALAAGLVMAGCAKKGAAESPQDSVMTGQLKTFAVEKESQAKALAASAHNELPPDFQAFFSEFQDGSWQAASNRFSALEDLVRSDARFHKSWWQPVMETYGAMEQFVFGDARYAAAYGNAIIQSIPPHSIYFGGTDPGRFIVTTMEKSQVEGDPFFTISQNPLTDTAYLDYLHSIYNGKFYIPTTNDLQKCFDDYFRDFHERQAKNQLLPGESITNGPDGKPQINSYISVAQIRGLLARMFFDHNTNQELYIEESFPLEWMYPYLEPHGLIFKLNHEPLDTLSNDTVQQDHDYWTNTVTPMIGGWLKDETSLRDLGAFAEKVYLHHDLSGFMGDPAFAGNKYAQQTYSKERSSIAGLYAWRSAHARDAGDKQRMDAAADFAFRQAWALCPYSPEVVFRYVQFLMMQQRASDALLVAETAAEFHDEAGSEQINALVAQLKKYQKPAN